MVTTTITTISRDLIDLKQAKLDFASNNKYSDVAVVKLDLSVDSEKILNEVNNLKLYKRDLFEDNVTKQHNKIIKDAYKSVTLSDATQQAKDAQEQIDLLRGVPWNERQLSVRKRVASILTLNEDYDPLYDERNYTSLDTSLTNTYTYDVIQKLKSKTNRTRVSTLVPGSGLSPHKDIPVVLGGRIHIPLQTNKYSIYFTQQNGVVRSLNMEAGSVYFINSSVEHWAHNFSEEDRIHMVLCCSAFLDSGEVLW